MEIHQFVHTLNYGDAISGEALQLKQVFQQLGHTSRIYTVHAHEKVQKHATRWEQFRADTKEALDCGQTVAVVLHYSIASPLNRLYSELREVKRIMIYHNLTPVKWFDSYNARVAADLRTGRDELRTLAECSDILLADSEFNRCELDELGCQDALVLPLSLDETKWAISANAGIARVLTGHGGKNILHVGRLAPNKRVEDIIKAFYFYHHKIEPQSRLWLIGSDIDTELYSFELRRLVSELRLKEAVEFVGSVADSELRAFYENADLYMCMSEHEGFCVPLLEAMYFGVPVVAFGAGAVSETLGGGGVLLARKSPAETAELMDLLINDSHLRQKLISRGHQRVESFSAASFQDNVNRLVLTPLVQYIKRK